MKALNKHFTFKRDDCTNSLLSHFTFKRRDSELIDFLYEKKKNVCEVRCKEEFKK